MEIVQEKLFRGGGVKTASLYFHTKLIGDRHHPLGTPPPSQTHTHTCTHRTKWPGLNTNK